MKGKVKWFTLCVLMLGLLAALTITGCGTDDEAAPEEDEVFILGITGGRPGDPWYVLSHALAGFINERADGIQAEVRATGGIADNTRMLVGDEEAEASHLNCTMIPGHSVWGEPQEDGQDYIYPLKVGSITMLNDVWVSYDPDIQTLEDFEGKTVMFPRDVPHSYANIFINWVELAGINVNVMQGGIGARADALRDGAADIACIPVDFYYPDEYAVSGSMMELMVRGDVYFPNQGNVQQNIDLIAEACKTDPFVGEHALPPLGMVIPPGALGENQTDELAFVATPVYWSASAKVPDEIIYEVTKILYEAAQELEFAAFHAIGRGITEEFVRSSFWTTEEERRANYHPGALQFYDEQGIDLLSFMD